MPRWNLHYLAGLFDGEGNVSAVKRKPASYWRVQVNSTDRTVVEGFYETFGGYLMVRSPRTERHREQYQWRLHDADGMYKFAETLAPLCKTKQPQLEALLLACETYGQSKNSFGINRKLSDVDLRLRDMAYRKVRQANRGLWDNVEVKGHVR